MKSWKILRVTENYGTLFFSKLCTKITTRILEKISAFLKIIPISFNTLKNPAVLNCFFFFVYNVSSGGTQVTKKRPGVF